jgi:Plasmid recombination enzyme
MSYLVARMEKRHSADLAGMGRHNERIGRHSNSDIDPTRTHMNYHVAEQLVGRSYAKSVDAIIEREREKYGIQKAYRKDAVKMVEVVVTSDTEFFNRIGEAETKRFFEKAHEFLADRFGAHSCVAGTVHLDETTPHMHWSFVPIRDGQLTAKTLLGDREVMREFQDRFHAFMLEQGFQLERGEKRELTQAKHQKTAKFKSMQAERLEMERADREQLNRAMKDHRELPTPIKRTTWVTAREEVVLTPEQWAQVLQVHENDKWLKQHIDGLKNNLSSANSKADRLKDDVDQLKSANRKLRAEFDELRRLSDEAKLSAQFIIGHPDVHERYVRWKDEQEQSQIAPHRGKTAADILFQRNDRSDGDRSDD